jgi:hypothetical protein
MFKKTLILISLVAALAAVMGTASTASAHASAPSKPVKYAGKTKEGTKISFVLDHGWVRRLNALVPTTCVSAQGGTPKVDLVLWEIPYKFKLGSRSKVVYGDPTRHYTMSVHNHGKRIAGKLSMNYSVLGSDGWGGYRILECLGTASFDVGRR